MGCKLHLNAESIFVWRKIQLHAYNTPCISELFSSLINTNLCVTTQKSIRQRNADVKVDYFQNLLFHVEQFAARVRIIADVQKVVDNRRTSFLL